MKVYFCKAKENEPGGVDVEERTLYFSAIRPQVIQPSEIMRIPVNVVVKVEDENGILEIKTHPKLSERVGELFPAMICIDKNSPEVPVEIPIRNSGRSPIHLMPRDPIAIGHVLTTEPIEPEDFHYEAPVKKGPLKRSAPQKRNQDVRFEVK
ncbi:MAG: hypothetical protein GF334_04770 [Candidatus Altiarchaeales archaeon]|nr:hypothetical protein [Candidatus Altiarchaeales archaeon]